MTTIIICKNCFGEGVRWDNSDKYQGYGYVKCDDCNGSGRLKVLQYSIEFPYEMERHIIDEYDNRFINMIREIKNKTK